MLTLFYRLWWLDACLYFLVFFLPRNTQPNIAPAKVKADMLSTAPLSIRLRSIRNPSRSSNATVRIDQHRPRKIEAFPASRAAKAPAVQAGRSAENEAEQQQKDKRRPCPSRISFQECTQRKSPKRIVFRHDKYPRLQQTSFHPITSGGYSCQAYLRFLAAASSASILAVVEMAHFFT